MKIVAIIGSPHGMNGNTGTLLEGMLQSMRKAGADVDTYALSSLNVQPCRGCDCCHIHGTCAIDDDYSTLRSALAAADGLVLASPNYIFSVSAQMKAMLDRCCGLLHQQAISGKYAAAVVTSGGPGSEQVEDYLLRFLRSLGYTTVGSTSALGWQLRADATKAGPMSAAAELGTRLVEAIREQTVFPEQAEERQAFLARMQELVRSMKDHWRYEYEYWAATRGV